MDNLAHKHATINTALQMGADLHLFRMWNSEREELGRIGRIEGDTVYGLDGEELGLLGYMVGDDAIVDCLYAEALQAVEQA